MAKKSLIPLSDTRSVDNTSTKRMSFSPQNSKPSQLWLWITSILLLGIIILGGVSYITWHWLTNVQVTLGANTPPQSAITTLNVQRTGTYANLSFTVLNAQYAATFPNDTIQAGPAFVRVNLQVANNSTSSVSVVYYDVARLLVPDSKQIAPTNLELSSGPKPGASSIGWMDFPVAKGVQLSKLKLQLGSETLHETLLTIPFSGPYDPNHFAGKTSPQTLTIYYDFSGTTLTYHLTSVNVLYAYRGAQAQVGRQFYELNFSVDNTNGITVSPGFGFDYIRLVINGYNTPPIDNTLPHDFKAGAQGVTGRVVYVGPANMNSLTFAFLIQLVQGQNLYSVSL